MRGDDADVRQKKQKNPVMFHKNDELQGTNRDRTLFCTLDSPVTEKAGEPRNSLPGPDVLWWSVGVSIPFIEFETAFLYLFPPKVSADRPATNLRL